MTETITTKNELFDGFRKRSGLIVPFSAKKIEMAIHLAVDEVARKQNTPRNEGLAPKITDQVLEQLNNPQSEFYVRPETDNKRIPRIEDVQDLVEILLAESGETLVVAAYKRYRKQRELARNSIRVRDGSVKKEKVDVTDASLLLVESHSSEVTLPWDRKRIVKQILDKTDLAVDVATSIAKSVENRIIASNMKAVNTTLIREMVNNELAERGYQEQLRDLSLYGIPRDYVEKLMFTKSTENSNIVNNNPEAVNLGIAELVLKQWALDTIFCPEIKRAHNTGAVHLHDLGYPHRVYCSSHSIEYVKKYGLKGLINLNTESSPAKTASVLTGHLNTFLASMQANYAGALGIAYINILYAPYLVGMNAGELKQIAQELIFNGSQNAFSRGGQTLFLDFNIHSGVPGYMKTVPAIGPGGKYMLRRTDGSTCALTEVLREERDASDYRLMDLVLRDANGTERTVLREIKGKDGIEYDETVAADVQARGEKVVTYGDFTKEAQEFCRALLEVWGDGDCNGRIFEFPKCDFHISDETFTDPEQYQIYQAACRLAAKNGSTYFIFDRDEVTLSACCRLRTTISDNRMLRHPENMRFCGFQNVTINIPQAAYRAARKGGDILQNFYDELDSTMELVAQAHLQKKAKIAEMISGNGHPLWQIGKESCDGKPYVNLDTCTYIIGLIGVNDTVKFLIGQELHDSDEAQQLGLRIVAHMYTRTKKLSKKHNLKFTLEESPAESAARRLAKTDLVYFHDEAKEIVKGETEDVCYYTNSVHLTADAPVGLVGRIVEQGKYHSLIESGAITHAFIGEEQPSAAAIEKLMTETFFRTQSAQVTVSPEFTFCNHCHHQVRGLIDQCPACESTDVVGETRVVGYFSKIQNWNKSKRYGELKARQRGAKGGCYSVTAPDSQSATVPQQN
jgi:anaerobic ribonucleoside-triphosphate reductase